MNKDHVDNWLRTTFIPRGDARRLSIELKFTIRDCKLFPHTARTCKETFTLLYYESDSNFASKDKPSWSDQTYKRVDRVTADSGRFTEKDNVKVNTEVRSVPVTKKGVYFAFRDEGACISLLGVRVSSIVGEICCRSVLKSVETVFLKQFLFVCRYFTKFAKKASRILLGSQRRRPVPK